MTEYYMTNSDESSVKTELEIDYLDSAPQEERPWLVWAFLQLTDVQENGLPTEKALQKLEPVIESLVSRASETLDAIKVGQRFEDGWVELYFYAPSAKKFQNLVAEVVGSAYTFDVGTARDAKWEHYLYTLYPDALMLQQIQTRHILAELAEEGDDNTKEREVEHYLGFLTEGHAKRVAEELQLHGFEKKEIGYNSSEEYGNTLVITQTHNLEQELLEELAFLLITTAEKEIGIYVGWSSGVAS